MKTLNVRELRSLMPQLRETLSVEREILLVSNGQPIARLLPPEPPAQRSRLPPLKAFRAALPPASMPAEQLIREDRDRRGT